MNPSSVINVSEKPAVSLIIPTEKAYPKYKIQEERMRYLLGTIEKQLADQYSKNEIEKITDKLEALIDSIDHKKLSRGLALYLSPERGRIIYLPFPVKEKTIVDSSFEVRDLLYSAKNSIGYMVLLVRAKKPEIYFGYNSTLIKEPNTGLPEGTESVERDYASKVGNFSDPSAIAETELDKYLREIDRVLSEKLKAADIPVIVCGSKRTVGHFKKITGNTKKIAGFIEKDFTYHSKREIYEAIEPLIAEKVQENQRKALQLLDEAAGKKLCVYGLEKVWRAATEMKGELLVVEKDFTSKAKLDKNNYITQTTGFDSGDTSVLEDAVDDAIELVLKSNGDVMFVDNGKLKNYNGIALIKRY